MVRRVAGEDRDVEAGLAHRIVEFADVLLVVAEEAVFVLVLRHEDGAAVRDLKILQFFGDATEVRLRRLKEARIARTHLHVRWTLVEQPPRKAAELPFGACVRARTKENPHALLLRDAAELGDILLAGEIVLSALHLVVVPEHVRADGVEAHRLAHLDAVTPVRARHAGEMELAAADLERLTVQQKRIALHRDLECMLRRRKGG